MEAFDDSPEDAATLHPAIRVRRPKKLLSRDIPRHWYAGEAFASHFLDALSSTFPAGEAFFVRSVLHYRDRIDDPRLLADIAAFAAQEGFHSRAHDDHVQLLVDHGYTAIAGRNRIIDWYMRITNEKWPRFSLAVTAAMEHLTAILARQMLAEPTRHLDRMEPEMAALWRWHALEEAEHKSVAYDVLMRVAPSHRLRVAAQLSTSLELSFEVLLRIVYLLWKDGLLFRVDVWRSGVGFLFGEGGLLRGIGAPYKAWFSRDFHPAEFDDRAMIDRAAKAVVVEIGR